MALFRFPFLHGGFLVFILEVFDFDFSDGAFAMVPLLLCWTESDQVPGAERLAQTAPDIGALASQALSFVASQIPHAGKTYS